VITGTTAIRFGTSTWIADTLMGWGTPQWRYGVAARKPIRSYRLPLFDDQFTSYFGDPLVPPAADQQQFRRAWAATGAPAPLRAVWRRVASVRESLDIGGCFAKAAAGDGVDLTLTAGGKELWRGVLTGSCNCRRSAPIWRWVMPVELVAGLNQTAGGDLFRLRRGAVPARCGRGGGLSGLNAIRQRAVRRQTARGGESSPAPPASARASNLRPALRDRRIPDLADHVHACR
jgi:hypothetical protein